MSVGLLGISSWRHPRPALCTRPSQRSHTGFPTDHQRHSDSSSVPSRIFIVILSSEVMPMTDILWTPDPSRIESSPLRAYLNWLEVREGRPFPDHDALWAWSVQDLDRFWI